MPNAAKWRFRGPIDRQSHRDFGGGGRGWRDRSFQLIVIGVITGEKKEGVDRGEKGEGAEWLPFVTFIVPRRSQLGRVRKLDEKYSANILYALLPRTICGRGKIKLLARTRRLHSILKS